MEIEYKNFRENRKEEILKFEELRGILPLSLTTV